jgi:hypothetical protein
VLDTASAEKGSSLRLHARRRRAPSSRSYKTLNGAFGEIRTADIADSYLEFFSDVWPEG